MTEPAFSLRRLWLLLRGDFLAGWRTPVFFCVFTAVVLFPVSLQRYYDGLVEPSFHQSLFGYGLFIWGLFATSRAFRTLHDRTRREAYLLVPASTLEKLLARLLPVTLGLGIALPVYFFILSVAVELLNLAIYGSRRPLFNPLDPGIWNLYGTYLVLQSPFFLGAIWFRRLAFLKTLLALVLLNAGLALLGLITVHLATGISGWHFRDLQDLHPDWSIWNIGILDFLLYGVADLFVNYLMNPDWSVQATILRLMTFLFPPVLWWIAWLRLREAQVNDGI